MDIRRLAPFCLALMALIAFGHVAPPVSAQAQAPDSRTIEIVQRYDFRRRLDDKYAGLFYGCNQSFWRLGPAAADGSAPVNARSYLMEESIKDLTKSEKTLSSELESSFVLDPDWSIRDHSGDAVPLARGFPSLPGPDIGPGDSWDAPAWLSVDPAGSGSWTKIKLLVRYRLIGNTRYQGRDALDLRAQFAIRYKKGQDPDGDSALISAEGTREAWITLDADTLQPLFIREKVSGELYRFSDGRSVKNDGFILTFFSGSPGAGGSRKSNKEKLEEKLKGEDKIAVREDERGITLSLEDLRFVADSPELLPGEDKRLIRIANALKSLPESQTFLVVGHTADVGSAESQMTLSLERARRISAALSASGIRPERFIVDGRGGTRPIGDNATEEGRALNRRVEIILLD